MGNEVKACAIITGCPDAKPEYLQGVLGNGKYDFIIAADAGYIALNACGIVPDLVIGDFDSSSAPDTVHNAVILPVDKAESDTKACVAEAISRGYTDIDIYYPLGGRRVDHSYSNLLLLKYCHDNRARCRLISDDYRLSLIDKQHTFTKEYDHFGLFAYLGDCHGVNITGALYSQTFFDEDEMDMLIGDTFAQSNQVTAAQCTVNVRDGILLLVECND